MDCKIGNLPGKYSSYEYVFLKRVTCDNKLNRISFFER